MDNGDYSTTNTFRFQPFHYRKTSERLGIEKYNTYTIHSTHLKKYPNCRATSSIVTAMYSSCLVNSVNGHIPASERIPSIVRHLVSERAKQTIDIVSDSPYPFANPEIWSEADQRLFLCALGGTVRRTGMYPSGPRLRGRPRPNYTGAILRPSGHPRGSQTSCPCFRLVEPIFAT